MKRLARQLCDQAEDLGYSYDRTNAKGVLIYVNDTGHELHISPSVAEDHARAISKAMRKACGTWQPQTGRNAQAVKERQHTRRELDRERLAAENARCQAERDAYLARIEAAPLLRADPEVIRWLEANDRRRTELEALMRTVPAGGDHQGRRTARHTSGERAAS